MAYEIILLIFCLLIYTFVATVLYFAKPPQIIHSMWKIIFFPPNIILQLFFPQKEDAVTHEVGSKKTVFIVTLFGVIIMAATVFIGMNIPWETAEILIPVVFITVIVAILLSITLHGYRKR